ncbi:MAG: DNA repair protein RecN [Alphaproteobacteria bacterium]|nr:DNA repair protein RecN [Alphaproteobacteria bacterium]MBF0130010.1 DNA repair protein RecN [Alphaproteobacteria bacterium]
MLAGLSIRDVVLIDRLDLVFEPGLGVLTGETGAGKSILLDSLGLALGARADSALVRQGASQLSVAARFDIPPSHAAWETLREREIVAEGSDLVLRRVVTADGRSRAFLNDQPVSVGLLRRVGGELVEIHGQFDSHGLLDPAGHRAVLDAFGGLGGAVEETRTAFDLWREAARARALAESALAQARADEDRLRRDVEELDVLSPAVGEEASLAERRALLMHGEKLAEAMAAAAAELTQGPGVEKAVNAARRHLERVEAKAGGRLAPVLAALDRAAIEAAEAVTALEKASGDIDIDPNRLEQTEERLFALRAAARRHGVPVDGLESLRRDLQKRLAALEDGGAAIAGLARAEASARLSYVEAARALSRTRAEAASRIDAAVGAELPPLKLDRARFRTRIEPLEETAWARDGLDRVAFEVATNPGTEPGPIHKIASGGELARFMLALKVVLARTSAIPTLVFDEVDTGIGGATAHAVGERLARLAEGVQVLVVTHSPQVAARGDHHMRVSKREQDGVRTLVEPLDPAARREEIARMLAGAEITDEARAAADSLMGR